MITTALNHYQWGGEDTPSTRKSSAVEEVAPAVPATTVSNWHMGHGNTAIISSRPGNDSELLRQIAQIENLKYQYFNLQTKYDIYNVQCTVIDKLVLYIFMTWNRYWHSSFVTDDGDIILFGGHDSPSTAEIVKMDGTTSILDNYLTYPIR